MMRRWLPALLCCTAVLALPLSTDEVESDDSRRVLGSSVVTSVSVIMDLGNGTKKYFADAAGRPVPKPTVAALVGSPAQLMNPDRYEFYTFDESGDLVKRFMTLDEIQSIIANGEGEDMQPLQTHPNYYHQKLPSDEITSAMLSDKTEQEAVDMGELSPSIPGVQDVVFSVQNVLKEELSKNQLKPPKPVVAPLPPSTISSPDSSWSMIIPAIISSSPPDPPEVANTATTASQPQKSSTTSVTQPSTVEPQKSTYSSAEKSPVASNIVSTAVPSSTTAESSPAASTTEQALKYSTSTEQSPPTAINVISTTLKPQKSTATSTSASSNVISTTELPAKPSPSASNVVTTTAHTQKPSTTSTKPSPPSAISTISTTVHPLKSSITSAKPSSTVAYISTTAQPQDSSTAPPEQSFPIDSNVISSIVQSLKSSSTSIPSSAASNVVTTRVPSQKPHVTTISNVGNTTAHPLQSSISPTKQPSLASSSIDTTSVKPQKFTTASGEQSSSAASNLVTTTVEPLKSDASSAEKVSPVVSNLVSTTVHPLKSEATSIKPPVVTNVTITGMQPQKVSTATTTTTTTTQKSTTTVRPQKVSTTSVEQSPSTATTTAQPQRLSTSSAAIADENSSPITNKVSSTTTQTQKPSTAAVQDSTVTAQPLKSSSSSDGASHGQTAASNVVNVATKNVSSTPLSDFTSEKPVKENISVFATTAGLIASAPQVKPSFVMRKPNKTQEILSTKPQTSSTKQNVTELSTNPSPSSSITDKPQTTEGSTAAANLDNQIDSSLTSAIIAQLASDNQGIAAAQEFINLFTSPESSTSGLTTGSTLKAEEDKTGSTTSSISTIPTNSGLKSNVNTNKDTASTTQKSTTGTTLPPTTTTTKKPIVSVTKQPVVNLEPLSSTATSPTTVRPSTTSSKAPIRSTTTQRTTTTKPTTSNNIPQKSASSEPAEEVNMVKIEVLKVPEASPANVATSEIREPASSTIINATADLPLKTDSTLTIQNVSSSDNIDVMAELADSFSSVLSQVGGSVTTIDYEEELLLIGSSSVTDSSKVKSTESTTKGDVKPSTKAPGEQSSTSTTEKYSSPTNTATTTKAPAVNADAEIQILRNTSSTEEAGDEIATTEDTESLTTIVNILTSKRPLSPDPIQGSKQTDEVNVQETTVATTELYEGTTAVPPASEEDAGTDTKDQEQQKTTNNKENESNISTKISAESIKSEVKLESPIYNHAALNFEASKTKEKVSGEKNSESETEKKKITVEHYETTTIISTSSSDDEVGSGDIDNDEDANKFFETTTDAQFSTETTTREIEEPTTERIVIVPVKNNADEPLNNYKKTDIELVDPLTEDVTEVPESSTLTTTYLSTTLEDITTEKLQPETTYSVDLQTEAVPTESIITKTNLLEKAPTKDESKPEASESLKTPSEQNVTGASTVGESSTVRLGAESKLSTTSIPAKVEEHSTEKVLSTISTPVSKGTVAPIKTSEGTTTEKVNSGITWIKVTSSEKPEQRPATSTTPKEELAPPVEILKVSAPATDKVADKLDNKVDLEPAPQESLGLEITSSQLSDDVRQFAELCNELAFRLWVSISGKGLSSRSLILSPFAVTSLLAMVFLGARGPTSGQMNDILGLDDMVTFNPHLVFRNVTESVALSRNSGVATAAFVRELYSDRAKGKLLDFYKERVQQFYDGHVEEVNFATIGDLVRRRTNLLVKRQTRGKIAEFIHGNNIMLRPPLAVFSANILQTDCSDASTEGRDGEMYFTVTPAMRQRRLVPVPAAVWRSGFLAGYEPGLDATAVSLGDDESEVSVILVLPGQQGQLAPGDGLARLETRLLETAFRRRGAWSRLLRSLVPRPGLELQLPRFSHRSLLNLTTSLQRMGLRDLFSAERADLRGINGLANDLHLSDIVQVNTFSTCAEEGGIGSRHHVEVFPTSAQRSGRQEHARKLDADDLSSLPLALRPRQARLPDTKPRLRFDRPFLYFVRHNPTGLVLHMGRFNPRIRH